MVPSVLALIVMMTLSAWKKQLLMVFAVVFVIAWDLVTSFTGLNIKPKKEGINMSKSYKDNNKQPKKNNACKAIRAHYDEQESEQDMSKYVGTSFTMVSKQVEEDENL
jgi:septal ring-binding cell division protein DamX